MAIFMPCPACVGSLDYDLLRPSPRCGLEETHGQVTHPTLMISLTCGQALILLKGPVAFGVTRSSHRLHGLPDSCRQVPCRVAGRTRPRYTALIRHARIGAVDFQGGLRPP